uniref:Uncharacterized protein n=1 Tax=Panagrolaimus davidi TaxID=227884 RepID=A0A914QQK8_9BILA
MYQRIMSDFSLSPVISPFHSNVQKIPKSLKFKIPLWEIEEITSFVHRHRRSISAEETILLDRLIDRYERNGSEEGRKELKTFLIYLRRSVQPTPLSKIKPQIIDLDEDRPKSISVFSEETPRRSPPYKCPRNTKLPSGRRVCTCNSCKNLRNTRRSKSCYIFAKYQTANSPYATIGHQRCCGSSQKSKSSLIGTLKALKNSIVKQKHFKN